MDDNNQLSRRDFFKSSTLASSALLSGVALSSCNGTSGPGGEYTQSASDFPVYSQNKWAGVEGVKGLLFSQVGYETGYPINLLLRMPEKESLQGKVICRMIPEDGSSAETSEFKYWGSIWGSHWWIAGFEQLSAESRYLVEVLEDDEVIIRDEGLQVGKNKLWDATIEWSSVDMLERRVHFTKVGAGWQDAGTLWVESCAQSAMIIALEELLENAQNRFDVSFLERIYKQITVGCDYLVMTQEKALSMGFPEGAMTHDLHGHENDILPNDATKAVVALWKAVRLMPDEYSEQKEAYDAAAGKAFQWLTSTAKPMGDHGLSRFQRGLLEGVEIPDNEWQTRDILMLCQGALEKFKNGDKKALDVAANLIDKVKARQIRKEDPESGYYGHFREYDSLPHTEKAWSHGIVNAEYGADMGGVYPNYLMPVIEMLELWPDHEKAETWRNILKDFTYGYLIPVCEKNPFKIIPLGIFGDEGPVWFCGTFHGTNAIYGYTTALALSLFRIFQEPVLKDIAYGNLQWLAGLNGGITRENLQQGCVVYSADLPEGIALPASMICHIGHRWAGTWFQTRGVICNGFTTGAQFRYDVEPLQKNDGPFSLTDEDWIPHSAAWLTGLVRL